MGDGLASQENRCREYATYKDYDVVEVFKDDMSGKFERRPAMDRMLTLDMLGQLIEVQLPTLGQSLWGGWMLLKLQTF